MLIKVITIIYNRKITKSYLQNNTSTSITIIETYQDVLKVLAHLSMNVSLNLLVLHDAALKGLLVLKLT